MMEYLTVKQAFETMVLFLEDYYERTHSDGIAALLASLVILEDNTLADEAIWLDWIQCVQKIIEP